MAVRINLQTVLRQFDNIDFSKYSKKDAELWITKECVKLSLSALEIKIVIDTLLGGATSRLKIMVMGYKRHGKDTACEYLRNCYGVTFASSSYTACELFLFDKLKNELNYADIEEAFADRVNHRARWYDEIKAYNVENGLDALGKVIFESNDAYCGIRDKEEFYALKEAGLFDLAIWIDASNRLPPEDGDSMTLTIDDADIVITNNQGLKEFHAKLDKVYNLLLKP
jgi:hypothetical protein